MIEAIRVLRGRFGLAVAVAAGMVISASCGSGFAAPPVQLPPYCGIQMQAEVSLANQGAIAVMSAQDTGSLTQDFGPSGCSGASTSFNGFTNARGIDEHPEAKTNANWNVGWSYLLTPFSNCGIAAASGGVPSTGSTFVDVCHI